MDIIHPVLCPPVFTKTERTTVIQLHYLKDAYYTVEGFRTFFRKQWFPKRKELEFLRNKTKCTLIVGYISIPKAKHVS